MDRPIKMDDESMDQSAREEALSIPIGSMTRSRTRRLKEAIGGMIRKSMEQERSLGRSLVVQDTLITIQAISPSS
ncbi:hypothetical protein Bca4012_010487 [Brassica carinata]